MAIKSNENDGKTVSGSTVGIVFKNVGDVYLEGAESESGVMLGKTAHAEVTDEHTGKMGHMFLVHTGVDEIPEDGDVSSLIGKMRAQAVDQSLMFDVLGRADENLELSDVYKLASKGGPVAVYVDGLALQLLESAETLKTDEQSKELILSEVNETIAMDMV